MNTYLEDVSKMYMKEESRNQQHRRKGDTFGSYVVDPREME